MTLADENSDGLLVILTPQAMTDPTQTAEQLRRFAQSRKPILASWMGGVEVAAGKKILNRAGIPTFQYPDTAVRVFNYMWRYSYNLRALYETPSLPDDEIDGGPDRERAQQIIEQVRREGRTLLTEYEAKQVLEAYCLPVTPTRLARTADEAVAAAEELGYPVVLKLHSLKITHKTDVGASSSTWIRPRPYGGPSRRSGATWRSGARPRRSTASPCSRWCGHGTATN